MVETEQRAVAAEECLPRTADDNGSIDDAARH